MKISLINIRENIIHQYPEKNILNTYREKIFSMHIKVKVAVTYLSIGKYDYAVALHSPIPKKYIDIVNLPAKKI